MLLRPCQAGNGVGEELSRQTVILRAGATQAATAISGYLTLGHRLGRETIVAAGLEAEHIAFDMERIDLPAAIAQEAAGPHHALGHLVEKPGLVALFINGTVRHEMMNRSANPDVGDDALV